MGDQDQDQDQHQHQDNNLPTYQTVFYPDIHDDDDTFVLLHCGERILDQEDLERGYVSRAQLLDLFSDVVTEAQIGADSRIVEYELVSDPDQEGDVRTLQVR